MAFTDSSGPESTD